MLSLGQHLALATPWWSWRCYDEMLGNEPVPRRRKTSPAKTGTPLRILLASVVAIGLAAGGYYLVVSFIGKNLIPELGGSGGTHVVTEDVCLYEYSLGDLRRSDRLVGYDLLSQEIDGPLQGFGRVGSEVSGIAEDKNAILLKSKTTLEILKAEVFSSSHFLVHFVRVRGGPHSGKEGWMTDKYIRVNR